MNLLGDVGTEQGKQPTEAAVSGDGFGIKVGEAAVDQIVAQLTFEIAEAPAFQVHAAAQQAIGGHADPPGASGSGIAAGEALADQLDQLGILQQVVDGSSKSSLSRAACWAKGRKVS
jgi:hypothetical protein